jgi:hypothetical protein
MSTSANGAATPASDRVATREFVAAFILVGLVFPFASFFGVLGGYVYFVGPPLDFDAPHNGQVVVHIDVLGKQPPDIARIRITEVATGVTVEPSFSLARGRTYLFEVWDSKGRVEHDRFTL